MRVRIKISIIGELARILGREIDIWVEVGEKISDILDRVLRNSNLGHLSISRNHIIVVNGRIVDKDYEIKVGDKVQIVPIFFGG